MSEITEDSVDPDENSFRGAIHSNNSKQWLSTINLNQIQVTIKINTGVKVTTISENTYRKLQNVTLHKPTKVLRGPANS